MTLRKPNSKPGQYTNAFPSYKGNGVSRSCSKCGIHGPTGGMKRVLPYGLVCKLCAEAKK